MQPPWGALSCMHLLDDVRAQGLHALEPPASACVAVRSWQPDSYGTGGVTADDYRSIQWFKIDALTVGTSYINPGRALQGAGP